MAIINFLQWNDPNGSYTDDDCMAEEIPMMTYEDAVKYFFGVINGDFYAGISDSICEITYDNVIKYAKENTFYDETIKKLNLLIKNSSPTVEFYKGLI